MGNGLFPVYLFFTYLKSKINAFEISVKFPLKISSKLLTRNIVGKSTWAKQGNPVEHAGTQQNSQGLEWSFNM